MRWLVSLVVAWTRILAAQLKRTCGVLTPGQSALPTHHCLCAVPSRCPDASVNIRVQLALAQQVGSSGRNMFQLLPPRRFAPNPHHPTCAYETVPPWLTVATVVYSATAVTAAMGKHWQQSVIYASDLRHNCITMIPAPRRVRHTLQLL